MADRDYADLATKVAALEERMNTRQAEYKTDIARLAEDAAKRETRMIATMAVLVITVVGVGVAILGVLIRL